MNQKIVKRRWFHLGKHFPLLLFICLIESGMSIKAVNETKTDQIPHQQKIVLKGEIVDDNGSPLNGVTIIEKGTVNGVFSDEDGKFEIRVTDINAILDFSYVGFNPQAAKASQTYMKVTMSEMAIAMKEVVVVGYGAQKKESVVGSITQVNSDELKRRGTVSNITDALSGSMPGVTVMTSSNNPGGGGEYGNDSQILIRGMSTWNNAQPLILVDGMERSMNDVDINEIETFSVLKDASATAVFGVKGANGVILVTTKRGEVGKARVSAEVNYALKSLSKVEKPVGSYEALVARNLAIVNELPIHDQAYWQYYTSARELSYYRDNVDPEKYTNVDWQDVMLRDVAYSSKYNVNISGGTDFVKYFSSLGYVYEGDIFDTNNNARGYSPEFRYDRMNFRTNLDFALTKTTQFKVNLSGYYGKQQTPGPNLHNMWYGVYKYNPASPLPIYSDGIYGMDDPTSDRVGFNSYFYLNTWGTRVTNRTSITSDFELQQKLDVITKGLSLKGRFSYDNYFTSQGSEIADSVDNYTRKMWDNIAQKWVYYTPGAGTEGFDFYPNPLVYKPEYLSTTTASSTRRNMYYEMAINYNNKFGQHNVGALALFSRQEFATGSVWPSKREDWVGRITYDYAGRYLAEVNGAYNGSEKFGPKHKFDFFPSLALGWRISEEAIFKKYVKMVSNLKLKYSIGMIGNDNVSALVGQWPYMTTWMQYPKDGNLTLNPLPGFGYPYPQKTPYPIYSEGTPGNPDLRWEKAKKQNFGLEFGLWDGMISGSFDYFKENRYDMLVAASDRSVPEYYGAVAPAANLGKVNSNGLEFEIKGQRKFGKVGTWVSYNWTLAKNEILFKEDPSLRPDYQKAAGFAINQAKGHIANGIIQSWDEMYTGVINENKSVNSHLKPGDYRILDYNGDGIINNDDGCAFGYSTYPQNTYGFGLGADYMGFAIALQFYGAYNTTINMAPDYAEFDYNSPTVYPSMLASTWTPEYGNSDKSYRALSMNAKSPMGSASYYDGSFLRLKTAEMSYTFPKKLVQKLTLENLKLYVNGNNLLYWSKLPVDIEGKNFSLKSYPNTKQINFGLNVTF